MSHARASTSLDKALGQRVRAVRLKAGLSQNDLADSIGVTFQQVQKYELGTNRIPATRLMAIADTLGVAITTLLEAIHANPSGGRITKSTAAYPDSPEANNLLTLFNAIESKPVRLQVVALVKSMTAAPMQQMRPAPARMKRR
jgi:transcriptional regulator with XRE-family HTH domain